MELLTHPFDLLLLGFNHQWQQLETKAVLGDVGEIAGKIGH
jgi:hypothetical protein